MNNIREGEVTGKDRQREGGGCSGGGGWRGWRMH